MRKENTNNPQGKPPKPKKLRRHIYEYSVKKKFIKTSEDFLKSTNTIYSTLLLN